MNTLRQCVLASHNFESRTQRLPDFLFREDPRIVAIAGNEASPFSQIQPDLSGATLASDVRGGDHYRTLSPLLKCPSAPSPSVFDFIPISITSNKANRDSIETIDYALNGGFFRPGGQIARGAAISRAEKLRPPLRFADIKRGTSNVIHMWESAGGFAYGEKRTPLRPSSGFRSFVVSILISDTERVTASSRDVGAVYFWTAIGPRIGLVNESLIINDTNLTCGPFSFHGGVVSIARVDGSVSLLDQKTDRDVLAKLLSSAIDF